MLIEILAGIFNGKYQYDFMYIYFFPVKVQEIAKLS